jgi:Fur family zinc uptake transcriptional regulator
MNTKQIISGFPAPGHDHGLCTDDLVARAERVCSRRGSRLTGLRRNVLKAVAQSHEAAGAYDIIERLAASGARPAPMTVYRALDFLASHGLVHKIESRNAFVACSHGQHEGEAVLLVCDNCGVVAEFEAKSSIEALAAAARVSGFRPRRTIVELLGRCVGCGGAEATKNAGTELLAEA